jgi:ABC-type spermidine/putrescine transport system permease subunit II
VLLVKRKRVRTGGHLDAAGTVDQAHAVVIVAVAVIAVAAAVIVVVIAVAAVIAVDRSDFHGKTAY